MELNSIKIPEGYHAEIDNENGVINIVKNEEPKHKPAQSWSAYCAKTKYDGLYWVLDNGEIVPYRGVMLGRYLDPEEAKMSFSTKEKAEAVIALCQLMLLHEDWVGDWKPQKHKDGTTEEYIIIDRFEDDITLSSYNTDERWFIFPTQELAKKFKDQFSDLLEKAKYLL